MNVLVYITIVTLTGVGVSSLAGRFLSSLGGAASALVFVPLAIFLGLFLTFGVGSGVSNFCSENGIGANECIRTDDRTVWFFGVPFVAFPLYLAAMYAARSRARDKGRT